MANNGKYKIILFDGVCNLCNSSVNFIIDRDKKNIFRFAALQSETGQRYLDQFGLNNKDFHSIILIDGDKYYQGSTAALKIAKDLGFFWRLLYSMILIPTPVRDFFYSIIANNRYKWFGQKNSCRIPTPELKDKFL